MKLTNRQRRVINNFPNFTGVDIKYIYLKGLRYFKLLINK